MSELKATWEMGEPNIASALARNKKGICSCHECNRLLSDPPSVGMLGLKICDECRQNVDKILEELRVEALKCTKDFLFSITEGEGSNE